MHLACINNQPRVLQYLLGTVKRYKTDTPNKLGRTALNIAASQGAFECIEILLDNLDCDINSTDKVSSYLSLPIDNYWNFKCRAIGTNQFQTIFQNVFKQLLLTNWGRFLG